MAQATELVATLQMALDLLERWRNTVIVERDAARATIADVQDWLEGLAPESTRSTGWPGVNALLVLEKLGTDPERVQEIIQRCRPGSAAGDPAAGSADLGSH